MKKVIIFIMLFFILTIFNGCTTVPELEAPEPLKLEETPLPDDIMAKIVEMKESLGEPPNPVIIEYEGQKYIAFTPEEFKKIIARNYYTESLEELINLQYQKSIIYVTEINQLKHLINMLHQENIQVVNMYNRLGEELKRKNREITAYRVMLSGSILGIILLAL